MMVSKIEVIAIKRSSFEEEEKYLEMTITSKTTPGDFIENLKL
jgi:hypothetical protein